MSTGLFILLSAHKFMTKIKSFMTAKVYFFSEIKNTCDTLYFITSLYDWSMTFFIALNLHKMGSSQLRDWTWVSCTAGRFFTNSATRQFPCVGNGNPFQYSWLENPMDRGDCRSQSMGLQKSRTWLDYKWCKKFFHSSAIQYLPRKQMWHISLQITICYILSI